MAVYLCLFYGLFDGFMIFNCLYHKGFALRTKCSRIEESQEEEVPLLSAKFFSGSNQVFQLSKTVLLLGLHQRTVCFIQFLIRYDFMWDQ